MRLSPTEATEPFTAKAAALLGVPLVSDYATWFAQRVRPWERWPEVFYVRWSG